MYLPFGCNVRIIELNLVHQAVDDAARHGRDAARDRGRRRGGRRRTADGFRAGDHRRAVLLRVDQAAREPANAEQADALRDVVDAHRWADGRVDRQRGTEGKVKAAAVSV